MRISSTTISSSALFNIQSASERFFKAQQQVSTARRLNTLSDDPAALPDDLSLHSALDNIAQFQKNLDDAKGFVGASDIAVGNAISLVRNARVIALQGATDGTATNNREVLAGQVDALIEALAGVANSSYGKRYLFAGQRTSQAPFVKEAGEYAYRGGARPTGDAFILIDTAPRQPVVINKPGDEVFNQAFDALKQLKQDLKYGQAVRISQESIPKLDQVLDSLVAMQADYGAKVRQLQTTSERYASNTVELTAFLSKIEDADIPKAITELQTAQTAYQAALTATTRGFQQSLLDFLK